WSNLNEPPQWRDCGRGQVTIASCEHEVRPEFRVRRVPLFTHNCMCLALRREDLIDDPRFRTTRERSIHAGERRALTASELEKRDAAEILARLLANDVPSAPVLSRFELLNDEQVRANAILEESVSAAFGRLRMPQPAAQFDRTPAQIRTAAPVLGADN